MHSGGKNHRACPCLENAGVKIRELQAKVDAELQQGMVGQGRKPGTEVLQRVTPTIMECIYDALEELGEAEWTLLPLQLVGASMDMCGSWTHAPGLRPIYWTLDMF